MKQLNRRFEMLISAEQSETWSKLAKSQNLTKAELVRKTMESYVEGKTTLKNWEIYQKLGVLVEELENKSLECFDDCEITINEIKKSLEQIRLELIFAPQQLKRIKNL